MQIPCKTVHLLVFSLLFLLRAQASHETLLSAICFPSFEGATKTPQKSHDSKIFKQQLISLNFTDTSTEKYENFFVWEHKCGFILKSYHANH